VCVCVCVCVYKRKSSHSYILLSTSKICWVFYPLGVLSTFAINGWGFICWGFVLDSCGHILAELNFITHFSV